MNPIEQARWAAHDAVAAMGKKSEQRDAARKKRRNAAALALGSGGGGRGSSSKFRKAEERVLSKRKLEREAAELKRESVPVLISKIIPALEQSRRWMALSMLEHRINPGQRSRTISSANASVLVGNEGHAAALLENARVEVRCKWCHRELALPRVECVQCPKPGAAPELEYQYLPVYRVADQTDILQLAVAAPGGVLIDELIKSHPQGRGAVMRDVKRLEKEEKVMALRSGLTASAPPVAIYPPFCELDLGVGKESKERWRRLKPDKNTLQSKMGDMGVPYVVKKEKEQFRIRRRRNNTHTKAARKVSDVYNDHVPVEYKDDSWKKTLEME